MCLKKKTGQKPDSCTYKSGIEVVATALGVAMGNGITDDYGDFEMWVTETGTYSFTIGLSAKRQGYVQAKPTPTVRVNNVKARASVNDPIKVTNSKMSAVPPQPNVVLVVYEPEESDRTSGPLLVQSDSVLSGCMTDSKDRAVDRALVSVLVADKNPNDLSRSPRQPAMRVVVTSFP